MFPDIPPSPLRPAANTERMLTVLRGPPIATVPCRLYSRRLRRRRQMTIARKTTARTAQTVRIISVSMVPSSPRGNSTLLNATTQPRTENGRRLHPVGEHPSPLVPEKQRKC